MKFAIALIAGVAIFGLVQAAPAVDNEVYISESSRDIIAAIRGRIQKELDDLQTRRAELKVQVKNATGEARAQLRRSLDKISEEIRTLMKQLLDVIKRAERKDGEQYFRDAIVEKIREYREKAKEILKRVSEIVKREAAAIHDETKAILEEQKQKLIDQVQKVNDQIKQVVNEVLNGKEEQYAVQPLFINTSGLREKIAELAEKASELANKARAAVGAKKDEILKQLNEVRNELLEAAKDLRNDIREIFGKERIPYSFVEDLDELYFVQTVKDLRKKLNEKLAQIKALAEMIKTAHGVATEQVKAALRTAKEQLEDLKNQIIEKVKEEINKPIPE